MPQSLYILPFDHRSSFIKMFGFHPQTLTESERETLRDYKHLIYEGFLMSLMMGVPRDGAALLVDEEFGKEIHEEARKRGITRLLTVEKSGTDEFDFEYGDTFREHIEALHPEYVKVSVRYNPQSERGLNERQISRLKIVSEFCKDRGYKFLFELLAVPTPDNLRACGGDRGVYDRTMRWGVMQESIKELQESGIEPDIWKLEGLEDERQMAQVVSETQRGGRDEVRVVVLGRGENEAKVTTWLQVAASTPGVIGFAVGRTVFVAPLLEYQKGVARRDVAAQMIAKNYKHFLDIFECAHSASLPIHTRT